MIKNLIFDVGNVLIEYRWHQMLLDYGLTKEEAAIAGPLFFDHETWKELDLGNMPVEDVIVLYEKQLPQYAGLIRWFLTHLELMPIPRPELLCILPTNIHFQRAFFSDTMILSAKKLSAVL
jgi:putative hydrolase of the HAD superfamily